MKRFIMFTTVLLIIFVMGYSSAQAEWQLNGNAVCTDPAYKKNPYIVSDGTGGIIIVWGDKRAEDINPASGDDLYAQRIDAMGNTLWASDGICLTDALDTQVMYKLIADSNGDAIALWSGYNDWSINRKVYIQKITSAGVVRWGNEGIPVCNNSYVQGSSDCISDGSGGAVVVWNENRGTSEDVFAQRVDSDGNILWNPDGVPVCTASGDQDWVTVISDHSSGVIVVWCDTRNGDKDIYAQRIDSGGNILWTLNGVAIVTGAGDQWWWPAISDGTGGAYISWTDENETTGRDIYAQRINSNGSPIWNPGGIAICEANGYQSPGRLERASDGGVILVWEDNRLWYQSIYAQKVSSNGSVLWENNGVILSSYYHSATNVTEPGLTSDNSGGAIVTWRAGYSSNIFVERIGADGLRKFSLPLISSSLGGVDQLRIASDDQGGAFISWRKDILNGNTDIYAQRVGYAGDYPKPTPSISAVNDIPLDEGGWLSINVSASVYDVDMAPATVYYPISGYNVWRKSDNDAVTIMDSPVFDTSNSLNLQKKLLSLEPVRITSHEGALLGFPPGAWESLGFHAATQSQQYRFIVPTRRDSTTTGAVYETFMVSAHTDYSSIYFFSEPDSGYSVDNLSPRMPSGFVGEQVIYPFGLYLTWDANIEADLSHYTLYRGSSADFEPNQENRITILAQSYFLDSEWDPASSSYYKLCAVDRHDNQSGYSLLMPDDVVASLLQTLSIRSLGQTVQVAWTLSSQIDIEYLSVARSVGEDSEYAVLNYASIERYGSNYSFADEDTDPGNTYRYRIEIEDDGDKRTLFETESITIPELPLILSQNYPNPFNPSTTINFYLPHNVDVLLKVFDVQGKRIRTLSDKPYERGRHEVVWDGMDDSGAPVASGVYFYRMTAGKETISKKLVLLR